MRKMNDFLTKTVVQSPLALPERHAEAGTASSTKARVLIAVRVEVSVVLLALLFSRMDLGDLATNARQASVSWLLVALVIYFAHVLASTWRWRVLLDAQSVHVPRTLLLSSYLVAIFSTTSSSNIGGDVIRISDTARRTRSKTLATTIVPRGSRTRGPRARAGRGGSATIVGQLQGHVPSPICRSGCGQHSPSRSP
jgi:hypothetical protein